MRFLRDSLRIPKVFQTDSWWFSKIPMESRWDSLEIPQGIPKGFPWDSKWIPRDSEWISIGFQIDSKGIPKGWLKDPQGILCMYVFIYMYVCLYAYTYLHRCISAGIKNSAKTDPRNVRKKRQKWVCVAKCVSVFFLSFAGGPGCSTTELEPWSETWVIPKNP